MTVVRSPWSVVSKAITCLTLCAILFALGSFAQAQQPAKIPKLGWLAARSSARVPSSRSGRELFWREFRTLGYVEGKNIAFEYRTAENRLDRLPALADELVHLKVDILIAAATDEALAAKKATGTIPIVFFSSPDPVVIGLVDTLARPGGNITGFTIFQVVLTGKRLELLKETIPNLTRVAVLRDPNAQSSLQQWKENQLAARDLGLQLHSMEVGSTDKFDNAFKEAIKSGSAALTVTGSPFLNSNLKWTVDLAAKYRLPAIYPRGDFVESGGLMSYGSDQTEPYRRVAMMVDKILKGAKPADIPVEQPTKFELIINLKAAKQIGLTIPPNVLARADKVIK
jgi:ABC-type uncharacterized transport system substrate-binding protein